VPLPNGKTRFARFPLEAAHSPIHGWGIFALDHIPRGAKIAEWADGVEMTYKDVKRLFTLPDGTIDWRYIYQRRPWQLQIVNKALKHRNISNYTNDGVHGQARPWSNVQHKQRWLVATEDIAPGEELLLNYGDKYWKSSKHAGGRSAPL
jgi:hypothetical protein